MRVHPVGMFALLLSAGCAGRTEPELIPVTGNVTWKGKPLSGADVRFIPVGETRGGGAAGRTDANGTYQLTYVRGGAGTMAGDYKVVVSKRVMPDGSDVPENYDVPPIDSPAKEILPARFHDPDHTELKTTVEPGAGPKHFDLKTP